MLDPRKDDRMLRESLRAIEIFEGLAPVEKERISKLIDRRAEEAIAALTKALVDKETEACREKGQKGPSEAATAKEIMDGMFGPKDRKGRRDPNLPLAKRTWGNARRLACLVVLNEEKLLPKEPPPPLAPATRTGP